MGKSSNKRQIAHDTDDDLDFSDIEAATAPRVLATPTGANGSKPVSKNSTPIKAKKEKKTAVESPAQLPSVEEEKEPETEKEKQVIQPMTPAETTKSITEKLFEYFGSVKKAKIPFAVINPSTDVTIAVKEMDAAMLERMKAFDSKKTQNVYVNLRTHQNFGKGGGLQVMTAAMRMNYVTMGELGDLFVPGMIDPYTKKPAVKGQFQPTSILKANRTFTLSDGMYDPQFADENARDIDAVKYFAFLRSLEGHISKLAYATQNVCAGFKSKLESGWKAAKAESEVYAKFTESEMKEMLWTRYRRSQIRSNKKGETIQSFKTPVLRRRTEEEKEKNTKDELLEKMPALKAYLLQEKKDNPKSTIMKDYMANEIPVYMIKTNDQIIEDFEKGDHTPFRRLDVSEWTKLNYQDVCSVICTVTFVENSQEKFSIQFEPQQLYVKRFPNAGGLQGDSPTAVALTKPFVF